MSSTKQRQYDQEFKHQAVNLVLEQGYKITEAAANLGVSTNALSRWIQLVRETTEPHSVFPGKGKTRPEDKELARLHQEIDKLKRERAILKKALGYFAENQV